MPLSSTFRIVAHTADFGIAGQAPALPQLFVVMARGLFSLIADGDEAAPRLERVVRLEAGSVPALRREWLREINGLHHEHLEIYGSFDVTLDGTTLEARVRGEPIEPRHGPQHEVKGVTWHDLKVKKVPGGYEAFVLLDV